jgi:hypothetical protein
MTADEKALPAGKTGPLPFDTSVAHQARMYDYFPSLTAQASPRGQAQSRGRRSFRRG